MRGETSNGNGGKLRNTTVRGWYQKPTYLRISKRICTSRQTVVPKTSVTHRELVPRRTIHELIFKAHAHKNKTSEVKLDH